MKGIVITASNEISVREFTSPLYESIGKVVGGWIAVVRPMGLTRPFCMIVNEEGLLLELAYNAVGSYLYETRKHGSPILGNIVIMKEGMTPEGPDIIGLTNDEVKALKEILTKQFDLKEKENDYQP